MAERLRVFSLLPSDNFIPDYFVWPSFVLWLTVDFKFVSLQIQVNVAGVVHNPGVVIHALEKNGEKMNLASFKTKCGREWQ